MDRLKTATKFQSNVPVINRVLLEQPLGCEVLHWQESEGDSESFTGLLVIASSC